MTRVFSQPIGPELTEATKVKFRRRQALDTIKSAKLTSIAKAKNFARQAIEETYVFAEREDYAARRFSYLKAEYDSFVRVERPVLVAVALAALRLQTVRDAGGDQTEPAAELREALRKVPFQLR